VRGRQGPVAGYDAQAMVSPLRAEQGGGLLITAAAVTNAADDHGLLLPMMAQAEESMGQRAERSLADGIQPSPHPDPPQDGTDSDSGLARPGVARTGRAVRLRWPTRPVCGSIAELASSGRTIPPERSKTHRKTHEGAP